MKRRLSLLLAVVMILGSFSFAFAAEKTAEEEAGAFLKKVGVLEGINGELKLEDNLRRQDAVVLIARLHGAEEEAEKFPTDDLTFTDFKDPYYRPIIAWAVANNLVEGHTPERFGFNEDVTAQQYATILLRALGYNEEVAGKDGYDKALELAKELGLLENVEVEKDTAITRGQMSVLTFNALGTNMKDSDKTLADKLGIEMPEPPKPDKLAAKVLDTENLAEIVVELSNVDLVKNKDALLNPANYRLSNGVKVHNVHLDGDNVVLTLVPYGKVEDQGKFDSLVKGKKFNLTIRNIDPAINGTYRNILANDNAIPVVENVDFMGTHGIKVTTSEPIANPLERNFSLDSRTAMIVEQYGRDIILTPYHGKEFDKEAVELTIDKLEDFAGYTSVKTVEKMEISTDDALPKVEAAYRSGKELVVIFDRDVYHDSIKAYENRRELGNVSFVERRVPFYAEKAEKIDTNIVKYTFTRDIPKGIEITIEGVANHFNKAMEKDVVVPEEYKDDYAPVVIDFDDAVEVTKEFEDKLAKLYKDEGEEKYNEALDKGYRVDTLGMTITFDKDIAEFKDAKKEDIKVKDHFTLYELDITRKGETAASDVDIIVNDIDDDSIELVFKNIKVNNKDRDFDYILEVRNFTDTNRNRMEREYLDFQVVRQGTDFNVVVKDIKDTRYFNRDGVEIVLEFNKYVNKEEASNHKNYYLDGKLKVDEAIVERDGKTVSLVIYDTTKAKLLNDYDVLEISPRVQQLDWPYKAPKDRFFELKTGKAIPEPGRVTEDAITYTNAAGVIKDSVLVLDINDNTNNAITVTLTGEVGDKAQAKLLDKDGNLVIPAVTADLEITTANTPDTGNIVVPTTTRGTYTIEVTKGREVISTLTVKVVETDVTNKVTFRTLTHPDANVDLNSGFNNFDVIKVPYDVNLADLKASDFKTVAKAGQTVDVELKDNNNLLYVTVTPEKGVDYAVTYKLSIEKVDIDFTGTVTFDATANAKEIKVTLVDKLGEKVTTLGRNDFELAGTALTATIESVTRTDNVYTVTVSSDLTTVTGIAAGTTAKVAINVTE